MIIIDLINYNTPPPLKSCTEHIHGGLILQPFMIYGDISTLGIYSWAEVKPQTTHEPYITRNVAEILFICVKDIVHTEVKITIWLTF